MASFTSPPEGCAGVGVKDFIEFVRVRYNISKKKKKGGGKETKRKVGRKRSNLKREKTIEKR
jgi:hypothetical protein